MPRVSIVIPTYRRPEATVRAVKSALAQTIQDLEVIVVDDASGDGTAEAAERIGDARVRVLRQEKNQGASATRNRGIIDARAPFIALLDSDDELLPDSLEKRLVALEANPASPLLYSRIFYVLSPKVKLVAPERALQPDDDFFEALIVRQGLATSAMLARADALKQCLFDERLQGVDDWEVAIKLARLGPVTFYDEPLSIIHAEDESEGSRITFGLNPESEYLFLDLHREEFDRHPKAEAVVLYKLAMRAVRAGRRDLAEEYLARVVELNPAHPKAPQMLKLVRLGLLPVLPALLRLRWRLKLALGKV